MIAPGPICGRDNLRRSRRRMTLIAALKCKDLADQDVAVFCADRQQSAGDFKNFVDKLEYGTAGNVDFVIGGSGLGPLADGFACNLRNDLEKGSYKDKETLIRGLKATLKSFYRNEVRHYPAKTSDKGFSCLIGLRLSESRRVFTWKTDGPLLQEVSRYSLIGHEDQLYVNEIQRMYRDGLSIANAIHLGVHVIRLAKQTSSCVAGPIQMVLLTPGGIYVEDQPDVDAVELNIRLLYAVLDDMLLSFMDAGLSKAQFDEKVEWLVGRVRHLRHTAVQQAAQRTVRKWPNRALEPDPYPTFPPGGSITFGIGPIIARELAEVPAHVERSLEEMRRQDAQKPPLPGKSEE